LNEQVLFAYRVSAKIKPLLLPLKATLDTGMVLTLQ